VLERLQKILSARGIASRRKAEEYIEQGLVTVNGKVAKVGDKADPEKDIVEVSGKVMEARQEMLYYLLYKPVGIETSNVERVASSSAPDRAPSVRDILPADLRGKIYPVGRLDKDSEGLLLFTNDGVLAYRLTHPKFDHEKEYDVTVDAPVPEGVLRKLAGGTVKIAGERTKPATVRRTGPARFRITLTEGRNRQIRRMCQKVGCRVIRLERIRIVTLRDPDLKPGALRRLTDTERLALLRSAGL
jgi:pseudouridine synthase